MERRSYFKNLLFICFIACSLVGCLRQEELSNSKPNIILILADDLSYKDISFLGQKEFETPSIDKLCEYGLFFNNAYAGSPECAPSRCSLLEGKHTGHCRIRQNNPVAGKKQLRDEDITIAELLKKAGYTTGLVGKWGIGEEEGPGAPYNHGFDYTYSYAKSHSYYPEYIIENDKIVPIPENVGYNMKKAYQHNSHKTGINIYDDHGNIKPFGIKNAGKAKYSQNLIQQKAKLFIQANKDHPFFLYYATQLPHGPTIAPNISKFKDKPWSQKQKEWAAMINVLDQDVGELIELTRELGIDENTIFIFASDNGYSQWGYFARPHWEDDPVFKNKGEFRGGKFAPLEGGVRIPMIAYCPGKIKHGKSSHIVSLVDLFATVADLAGVIAPENDGISFSPVLAGNPEKQRQHEYLYWGGATFAKHAQAVRMRNWFAYREHPLKPMMLWDLSTDPSCENSLTGAHGDLIRKMERIMDKEHVYSPEYINPGDKEE